MSDHLHPVALVDDHEMVRSAIAGMIDRLGGYRVIGEASNGLDFVTMLNAGGEEPRIAVVDLQMPVMDGFETITWLRAQRPNIMALALTFDPAEDSILKAVRAGARGFLRKNARAPVLKTALDSLMLTGYYHSDEVHESMLQGRAPSSTERQMERVLNEVSPREMEFLKLVCSDDEHTYEQIAQKMNVHRRTIDGFRESLTEKFGIKSKTGLVLFALKWGIIKP